MSQRVDSSEDHEVVEERRPRTDSPTLLRKNLKHHLKLATKQDNIEKLKLAIKNYEEINNHESDSKDVAKAREKLYILEMKRAINEGIKKKDTAALKALLADVRKKEKEMSTRTEPLGKGSHARQNTIRAALAFEMQAAKKCIYFESVAEKRKIVYSHPDHLVLSKEAMADVTTYRKPPPGVHSVLQATLLLFGEDEDLTSDWGKCKALVHPSAQNGLLKRLPGFKYQECEPELVARSRDILDDVEFDDILRSSRSAACFYNYSSAIIDKFITEGRLGSVEPANIERQRQILNRPLTPRTARYKRLMKNTTNERESPVVEYTVG